MLVALLILLFLLHKKVPKNIKPSILIGTGNGFEKEKNFKLYSLQRTISIAVKNNTKAFISNCKLEVYYTDEKNNNKSISLDEGFTLNSTEQRYIEVCYYLENAPTNAIKYNTPPFIHLLPKDVAFYTYEFMLPASRKNIITFHLKYLEGEGVKKKCYLWIDSGQLKLEECINR
jgi:hypothetical protein